MSEDLINIEKDPSVLTNAPKKFVRTYESDAATLSQGGTPDFTAVSAPAPIKEFSTTPPTRSADELDLSAEKELSKDGLANLSSASERLIQPSPLPSPAPIEKSPAPLLPLPPPKPVEPETLHTYTSDFSDRLSETKSSTASVIAAESDAPRPKFSGTPQVAGNILYVAGGLILLILGAGGVYGVYRYIQTPAAPVIIAPAATAPIFVEEREEVAGIDSKLLAAIQQSVGKSLPSGSVRLLYTQNATTTGEDIFHALRLPAPNILLRNINSADSVAGIVNASGTATPFFILSVSSYGDTFAGMLAWEPRMAGDMSTLFPPYSAPVVATSTATSTPPAKFKDEVISNHDTRVLRNPAGKSVVLYGYWNLKTLIIARDEKAFAELVQRLATSKTQK